MLRQSNNIGIGNGFYWNGTTMTSSNEGFAVQLDTGGNTGAVKLAGAGTTNIGIIPNSNLYANGDPIEIVNAVGQVVDAIAGSANFAAGDLLKNRRNRSRNHGWIDRPLFCAGPGNSDQRKQGTDHAPRRGFHRYQHHMDPLGHPPEPYHGA